MELGKKIAYYRKNMNITQEALANQLGISNQAVSKWETEQSYPDVELLPKIADVFQITLDELFDRECTSVAKASGGDDVTLPWMDDGTLRAVLYVGHCLIQKEDLNDVLRQKCSQITVDYSGNVQNLESYFNVTCENVEQSIKAGGFVECEAVGGSITAGGYVECEDVRGNVTAGGYVECENVGGTVTAGGYVECEDVGNSVAAGSYIECGDVAANVTAGTYVNCGDIGGNLSAQGYVECGDVGGNVQAGKSLNCGDIQGRVIEE